VPKNSRIDGNAIMLLNAVMCVWNEEDIIESTIKHAFAQGCSNIFIIDNDSTDKTIDIAINAGAKLAAKFTTKHFDEDKKVAHLNATVKYINDITQDDKIWWLYIDADEFPNFDCKFTIIDVLKQLDSSIRAVHGCMLDHIPSHQPYHVKGYHPIDFQPLCTKSSTSKIPLLRYDKGQNHLWSIGGAHDFITNGDIIPIVKDFLHIHHFQYRNPEHTLARSKTLAQKRNDWYKKFLKQVNTYDTSAYESRYNKLLKTYNKNKYIALKTKSLLYNYKNVIRWYDINIEKKFNSSCLDKNIYLAIYYFFMNEYDIALCRFNDALGICNDDTIKIWLMVKIAECFAYSDIIAAHDIIFSLGGYNNVEINNYIDKDFEYIICKKIKDNDIIDIVGKIEFYQSVFPDGIEQRQKELVTKIEKNIFKDYRRSV
jgi:tetratricopeptide (TPR) repeat protein